MVFIVANNQLIAHNVEANIEMILLDIPNTVYMTNPIDDSAILEPEPFSPVDYVFEVFVCGGTAVDPAIQPAGLSSQLSATSSWFCVTLTSKGTMKSRTVEHVLEGCAMSGLVHLPNG